MRMLGKFGFFRSTIPGARGARAVLARAVRAPIYHETLQYRFSWPWPASCPRFA